MQTALSQGSGLVWKCSWQELEGGPQQSQPKLESQALVNRVGWKWGHQWCILQRVPRCGKFEFRFAWEGENLCAQESWSTFSAPCCLPPTLVLITPPHSDRQNLFRSSGSQNLPLLPKLEERYLNSRKPSLLLNHQRPLCQHPETCEALGFRYNFFLGTLRRSRENQCWFNRRYWRKINPLKVLLFVEKHKWIAELTTSSTVHHSAFRKTE